MSHRSDHYYMSIALRLAALNLGCTAPNPSVGCIIVKNNQIIGQGHTAIKGRPHAEQAALESCQSDPNGATAYVTLEPCSFAGQTPSCAELLHKAGIKHVVIAAKDPHPKVSGKGIEILQRHKIKVTELALQDFTLALYNGLYSFHLRKRPWITLKLATTLDGKSSLSNSQSKWITGPKARAWGHALRKNNDAILTGIPTIRHDNPELTCRIPGLEHKSPVRIICDSTLQISPSCNIIKTAKHIPTIIASNSNDMSTISTLTQKGASVWQLPTSDSHIDLKDLMQKLYDEGFMRILVEAGPTLTTSFIKESLVDDLIWFHGNKIFGGDATSSILPLELTSVELANKFSTLSSTILDNDTVTYLRHPSAELFLKNLS